MCEKSLLSLTFSHIFTLLSQGPARIPALFEAGKAASPRARLFHQKLVCRMDSYCMTQ